MTDTVYYVGRLLFTLTYGGMKVNLYAFLTLALDGGEWLASRPSLFYP
jgi:hypothetical protein